VFAVTKFVRTISRAGNNLYTAKLKDKGPPCKATYAKDGKVFLTNMEVENCMDFESKKMKSCE